MLSLISRDSWIFAVRGLAAILFGVMALAWPSATLAVLILLFGAYALVDGIALLISLARGDAVAEACLDVRDHGRPWYRGLDRHLLRARLTALSLLYIVAVWAIAMGVFQGVAAIALRHEIDGELWMGLGAILSVVFGTLLIVSPGAGLLTLVWIVGFWRSPSESPAWPGVPAPRPEPGIASGPRELIASRLTQTLLIRSGRRGRS